MKPQFFKLIILFLPLTSGLSSCHAQDPDFDHVKMDSLFARIEKFNKGMGSISIFRDGKEVYQKAYGYADAGNHIPATAETRYRIGSISKSFTASIIMQMVDEKKLTLGTKLSKFYPQIPNADSITIEELLRHRSGLYNFTSAPDYTQWMEKPVTEEGLIRKFIENGTNFSPDARMEYSNTNYVLLGFIAEKVDGKDLHEILKKRITAPLKLKDTYYGGKIDPKNNEAYSYQYQDGWKPATETDMSVPGGAGAVVSTPADLNIFLHALFNGKLVSENSLDEMKKMVEGYGMGLIRMPFYDQWAYGHTGGIDGFQSNAAYFPDEKVSFAFTGNGMVMGMNDILIGALSIYFGKEYALPEIRPAITLKSEDLDQYLGVYGSPSFPLKVTITKNVNVLIGQATGQSSFILEAFDTDKFRFEPAGIEMDFYPSGDKMILKQAGQEFELKRE